MPDDPKDPPAGGDGGEKPPETLTLTHEQLEDRVKDRLKRQEKKLRAEIPDALLGDPDYQARALSKWGAKLASDAQKLDDQKVQELRVTWEKEHLTPLTQRVQTLEQENGSLHVNRLEADILAAAGGMVKKGVLKMQGNGHSALFNMISANFAFDAETKSWRVKGKAEGQFRPSASGDKVYMDPAEWIAKVWAGDPENADFVLDRTQQGSDFKGGPGKDGKTVYSRAEYQKLTNDPDYYAQHRGELLAAAAEGRVRG